MSENRNKEQRETGRGNSHKTIISTTKNSSNKKELTKTTNSSNKSVQNTSNTPPKTRGRRGRPPKKKSGTENEPKTTKSRRSSGKKPLKTALTTKNTTSQATKKAKASSETSSSKRASSKRTTLKKTKTTASNKKSQTTTSKSNKTAESRISSNKSIKESSSNPSNKISHGAKREQTEEKPVVAETASTEHIVNTSNSSSIKTDQSSTLVRIHQSVAVLIDGNNIEKSIHAMMSNKSAMLDFDKVIPKILEERGLNRLIYFREGLKISEKLAERLHKHYHGSVVPCHKSADIPLTITATQIAEKVDTIIILSGDSDYVELVRHLKSRGVRVEIAAVKQTTAQILIEEADYFYDIDKADVFVFK